jgi:predicted nucleotidyltransferase
MQNNFIVLHQLLLLSAIFGKNTIKRKKLQMFNLKKCAIIYYINTKINVNWQVSKLNLEDERKQIMSKLKSEETNNFLDKYDISSMLTFGSLNNDNFTIESDIDIAIIGEDNINLEEILEIELFLERTLRKEIDVIDLRSKSLNIFLKINVLNEGKIIYSNDNNSILEKYKEEIGRVYKENEDFFWFRRKDVLS